MVGKPIIPATMRGSYEAFQFAPATRVGDLLILSGQIGTGPDGKAIDDLEEQFAHAFEVIGQVLHEAGLSFDNIVELHTFHVGLQLHRGKFMKVKARYSNEPVPCWTAIGR